jgi:hypothetical protein
VVQRQGRTLFVYLPVWQDLLQIDIAKQRLSAGAITAAASIAVLCQAALV